MWLGRAESSGPPPREGSLRIGAAAGFHLRPEPPGFCLAAASLFHVSLSYPFGVGLSPASSQAPLLPVAPCPLPWEGEQRERGQKACRLRMATRYRGKPELPVQC